MPDTRTEVHEARKTVTILFADVVASTELGELLDPEALRQVVSRYFAEMAQVLEQHGGTVEKFIGDEVMAVFGVPVVHEDDALRAVRAADAMHRRLAPLNDELEAAWGARLQIRIGINTGEVVAGDPSAGHGFVTGSPVNIAKRLEQAARPGEVLLGDATHRLVRHAVETTPIGPISLRGRQQPEAPQRLDDVDPRGEALRRDFDAPLVGRAAELARLASAFDRAVASRRPHLVTLLGEAGIGKSRIVRQLFARVRGEATALVGRCLPYGEGITLWPVREILPDEPLEGTLEEIFWRVRRRLEELAREQPLVVCFEDVHWAEPTFLDLVQYLAGWIRDAPVLLVCLARPDLLERRADWLSSQPGADVIAVGPLSGEETEELLAALGPPAEARGAIVDSAEGNPLFVEQMAAMAAEERGRIPVPPSIRALLSARLGRLAGSEAAVIERAAVVGREFPLRAVLDLVPEDLRPSTSAVLLALARKELIQPHSSGDDDSFRFRHALIRDAAYEGLPKQLRAELHERHAAWLEAAGAEDILVAYHLEQAHDARAELRPDHEANRELGRRAGLLLGSAGRRASARGDAAAAAALLRRAVRLLAGEEPARRGLLVDLAEALMRAGELAAAEPLLQEASDRAGEAGDRRVELRAAVERQVLRSFTAPAGAVDESIRVAEAVIPELEALGDDRGLAKAWRLMSDAHVTLCRWEARAVALERALVHARRVPEARHERTALVALLALALHYGPTPAPEAIGRCHELLDEAGDAPDLRAGVSAPLGALLATQGGFDEARALFADSEALHEELGLRFRRAAGALLGAEIETLAGHPAAAERQLRTAYATLEEMGESGVRAVVAAFLADVLAGERKDEEAESFALAAAELADPADLAAHVPQRVARARVLARRGAAAEAERLGREAVELADETDFLALRASAYLGLAEVVAHQPGGAEARRLRGRALELFEAKGNVVAARRLGRLLSASTAKA